eukprot:CAMPEP_0116846992 /NCGR_PEP_ID=MMETSP0418-20121206/14179_1 /TAXON_ID=1158023 /ORGANISM="Astrosyne radiata, Strain 13vi08-1A" /LENGTH=287 /DNA_ID=CAMNT_0004478373 /DNA_START=118 /DNA_END=981 /DNA_ORIENTATION=-
MYGIQSPVIGNDILDMGSRRASSRRCQAPPSAKDALMGAPGQFDLPNVPDPALYVRSNFASVEGDNDAHQEMKFKKGTTTLAFKFNGGIIVSVDSRATQGGFIASRDVDKVVPINAYLLGTLAGGAADCQFWQRNLGVQCRLYELRNGRRITVAGASKLLANTMSSYRGYGLAMGTMIVGWDAKGPQVYHVDNDGLRLKGKYFSLGSGCTFAYGVLDAFWREDLTVEEAIDLGKRAIYHAAREDQGSGGNNKLFHMTEDGWTMIHSIDVNDMHYEFEEEKKNAMASN